MSIGRAYDDLLVRENIDVVMTGDPGDIVFGYGGLAPAHLADPVLQFRARKAISSARAWTAHHDVDRPWTHVFIHHALSLAWRHTRRQSLITATEHKIPDWISHELLSRTGVKDVPRAQAAPRISAPGKQYLWESVFDMAAQVTDCTRLGSPAEIRHPLFHRPLLEFMLGLDSELRHGATGDRVLQRYALADRLPYSVRMRVTKGSGQRGRERAMLANDSWYRSLTENSRLVDRGWVKSLVWRQQIDRARLGHFGRRPNLDIAIMTELWLRTIEDHKPRPLQTFEFDEDLMQTSRAGHVE